MRKPSFYKSVSFALRGILLLISKERNFQIELVALLINLVLIVLLELSPTHAAIILLTSFLVLTLEAINTAIENVMNLLHPEIHPVVGKVKDIAAGSVLLAAIASLAVGALIYLPYLPL